MAQTRIWDYGAPRKTLLLNSRYLDVLPSSCVIAGFEVEQTTPASLLFNIKAGVLISQDGVVIRESTDLEEAVTIVPDVSNPRIDWIVATHEYSSSNQAQEYEVVQGEAGTPPVPPTLPDHAVKLAEIYVPASATEIDATYISNVPKTTVDSTLLNRVHLSELQPVPTSEHSYGLSDKVLVRAGTFVAATGTSSVTVPDQVSEAFSQVTTPGNERVDLLVITDNGDLYIVEGTEDVAGYAVAPDYPSEMMVLAEVTINEVGYEVIITQDDIRDVRPFLNLGGSGGSGGSGLAEIKRYDFAATGGQTAVNLPWAYAIGMNQLIVISSGTVCKVFDDYLESAPTSITFTSGRIYQESISVIRIGAATGSAVVPLHEKHIATDSQEIFELAGTYDPGTDSLVVIRNGKILVLEDEYEETDESTVTLTSPAVEYDVLVFKVIGATGVPVSDADVTKHAVYNLSLGTDDTSPLTIVRIASGCIVGGYSGTFIKPDADVTIDSSVEGVGGIDEGTIASNTWYAIYLIATDLGVVNGVLSTNFVSPTMPGGYTNFRRVGAVYAATGGNFRKFKQNGDRIRITDATKRVTFAAAGIVVRTWYPESLTKWVPETAVDADFSCVIKADDIIMRLHHNNTDALPVGNEVYPGLDQVTGVVAALANTDGGVEIVVDGFVSRIPIPERRIYWYLNNIGTSTSFSWIGTMLIGYTDNLSHG